MNLKIILTIFFSDFQVQYAEGFDSYSALKISGCIIYTRFYKFSTFSLCSLVKKCSRFNVVSVRLSVCRLVGQLVPPLLCWRFWRFASSFCITAPTQWHVTDAVVYTALSTAPAHHITALPNPRDLGCRVYGLVRWVLAFLLEGVSFGQSVRWSIKNAFVKIFSYRDAEDLSSCLVEFVVVKQQ